jgi:hypothetical protein
MAKRAKTLPQPWPNLPDDPAKLLDWASEATKHTVVGTQRPGVHEHAGLTVQLEGGHELYFETVADACRRERFTTSFMAIDGIPMDEWSAFQIKEIVGALVRAARVGRERDERETFTDLGARYVAGCLQGGGRIVQDMKTPEGEYLGIRRLRDATRLLRGEDHERWPEVLHAPDLEAMFVIRGLFLAFAKRSMGRMNTATVNEQMRRVGWRDVEFNPRPPEDWKGRRPHLRTWRIEDGWDDLWAADAPLSPLEKPTPAGTAPEIDVDPAGGGKSDGTAVPTGPGSTRPRIARGRSLREDHPGPRDRDQARLEDK